MHVQIHAHMHICKHIHEHIIHIVSKCKQSLESHLNMVVYCKRSIMIHREREEIERYRERKRYIYIDISDIWRRYKERER